MPFVHVTHETLGEALIPDAEDVVAMYEGRGWVRSEAIPAHLDPDAPNVTTPVVEPAAVEPEPDPLEAAARLIAERDAAARAALEAPETPPTQDDPDAEPGEDTDPGTDPADDSKGE